jgi:uncharacterized membrane protein (DUF106 family)
MAFENVLDPVFNPILQPLLNKSPFLAILILAVVISVVIVIVYKLMTDQKQMKEMKDQQKESQKKMKELKDNPAEMMKVQKEAMKMNMEYMKKSFKPTLVTMIPILLIFGWMAGHFSYEPIYPGETFSVTADFLEGIKGEAELIPDQGTELISEAKQEISEAKASWKLKSTAGEHAIKVKVGDSIEEKEILITTEVKIAPILKTYEHSDIKSISIDYKTLKPLGDFDIFGWRPGWLGLYIIFSLIFSMSLRKLLKIY